MLLNSQDVHVRNQLTQRINELTQRTNELLEENARLEEENSNLCNELTQRINELTQRTNELLEDNARLEEENSNLSNETSLLKRSVIDTIFMCQTQLKQQKLDDIKKSAHMMCAEKSYELRRRRQLARDIRQRVTEELTSAEKDASASPQGYSPEPNLKSRGLKDNDKALKTTTTRKRNRQDGMELETVKPNKKRED